MTRNFLRDYIDSASPSELHELKQLAELDRASPPAASRRTLPPQVDRTGAAGTGAASLDAAAHWSGRGVLELVFAGVIAVLAPVIYAAFGLGAYDVCAVLFGPLLCACWALCLCGSLGMRN